MKRAELKTILKECLEELFEENDYFMKMVSEAIKASVTATLKESMSHQIPVVQQVYQTPFQNPTNKPKQTGLIEKKGFDPKSFFNEKEDSAPSGADALKNLLNSPSERTEHEREMQRLNDRVPDEAIFGSNFVEKMQKFIKR